MLRFCKIREFLSTKRVNFTLVHCINIANDNDAKEVVEMKRTMKAIGSAAIVFKIQS